MYEIQKGPESRYYHYFQTWPDDTEILFEWSPKEMEELQDDSLAEESKDHYSDYKLCFNQISGFLDKHPEFFKPESYREDIFKLCYVLLTNRCFGSEWKGLSQMVPSADMLNHDNVNVHYYVFDKNDNYIWPSNRYDIFDQKDKAKYLHNLNSFREHVGKVLKN